MTMIGSNQAVIFTEVKDHPTVIFSKVKDHSTNYADKTIIFLKKQLNQN